MMPEFYRKYYRIDLTLRSPLSIGSGKNENTDKDVIVDCSGTPFIPASSLVGAIRNYVYKKYGRATANKVFGFIPSTKEENEKAKKNDPDYVARKTQVIVYDAILKKEARSSLFITSRDMVALENKVATRGAKFDMEAVEPDVCFTTYIELLTNDGCCDACVQESLAAMDAGVIRLGSKTTRGYGEVGLKIKAATFNDVDAWLEFDMMLDESWNTGGVTDCEKLPEISGYEITVDLRQKGGISIREYSTEPSTGEKTMPDYITMGLHPQKGSGGQIPVIPGTSWAGAFRERYKEFSDEASTKELFGIIEQEKKVTKDGKIEVHTLARKSQITFSESRLSGGTYKLVSRNSIDRFTGAAKKGALYTEKTYFDGETQLKISFTSIPEDVVLSRISACLADLHNGYMAVGGLTAIGRGLFEIVSINGQSINAEGQKSESIFNIIDRILKGDVKNE